MKLPKLPFKFAEKKQKKINIGLDWGFSSLKVVILESQDDTYMLKDVRIIELSSAELNLSSLTKDIDLSSGVNLGICGPNVVVRYVAMARMNKEEFRKSLRYEAASHLPFSVDELILDGLILKDLPDNHMLVMFAAAKKEFINQRLKLFQEKGIRVNILDIDSLALINAFNYNHIKPVKDISSIQESSKTSDEAHKQEDASPGAVVLLNIGASVTNINILEENIPHFSRDINVASRNFSNQASGEVAITNFVTEIRKSLDYYEAGSSAVIKKIFLSGGGSLVSGLAEKLNNLLGIQIEQWDPFSNFNLAPGLVDKDILKKSAQFVVAVGLALR